MSINFNSNNPDPQISFRPEPEVRFEKAHKIDGQKFNQIIEPYARGLEREHQKLENRLVKITKGADGRLILLNAGLCGVGAITFFALSIFVPLGPIMLLAFLGSGSALGYNCGNDIHKIFFKAPEINKKKVQNDELQGILKSEEFKTLSTFESRKDFFKILHKRIKHDELTENDLKALLVLHKEIRKDPNPNPQTDQLFEDLLKEWATNKRIHDWSAKLS